MQWKTVRNIIYLLLLAVSFGIMVFWWPSISKIWAGQELTFLGVVTLMIAGAFVQAMNFIAFLGERGSLRVWRFTTVWALSALANYAGPFQPGIAVRVAYLARCGVSVPHGLLATLRQLYVSVWVALAGVAAGVLLVGDPSSYWLAAIAACSFIGAAMLRRIFLPMLERVRRPHWVVRRKQVLQSAINEMSKRGVLGVILQYVLGSVLIFWTYHRFGAGIGIGQAIIMACLVYASTLVALLPGNLGVSEGLYILCGSNLGLSLADAAALALFLRGAHVTANLLLAIAGMIMRLLRAESTSSV